jgi:hypothetical protein
MTERPPDDVPAATLDVPPAEPTPPSFASSVGLGCAGFIGFFVLAAIATPIALSAGPVPSIVLGVFFLAFVAFLVKSATRHQRQRLARVAIGFAIAAVVFGGCLALIATADFR